MMQSNRQLVNLTMRIDSLEYEIQQKDQYMTNIRRVIGGDVDALETMEQLDDNSLSKAELDFKESIQPIDSQFRAEFENQEISALTYETYSYDEFREMYLFTPLEGMVAVTDGFNPKKDHYGVDLVAKENEPVKSAADGVVIFSSWTLDGGYVMGIQHRGNLISVYKHNSELLKNVGNFVSGGEIIAIIGNTGELTSGPHLHFELWHNGNPVNPQEYVAF
ncbi:MAG: peptidase M23 [Flammeovirgaceae bacterium]|nr:peptidase M23 [Flammeovirgaceae bacterium]MBE63913.1 peptidase M23 [Flammeovirgaceae bacterium]MBR06131.1 peptidase M23 [Rickettsiales bacterium]